MYLQLQYSERQLVGRGNKSTQRAGLCAQRQSRLHLGSDAELIGFFDAKRQGVLGIRDVVLHDPAADCSSIPSQHLRTCAS